MYLVYIIIKCGFTGSLTGWVVQGPLCPLSPTCPPPQGHAEQGIQAHEQMASEDLQDGNPTPLGKQKQCLSPSE